jgi:signal transduction histidine kinase
MSIGLGLRTTTGKLALFYAAVFGAMTLIAIAAVHAQWTRLTMREIGAALNEQSLGLADVLRDEGPEGLRRGIELRIHSNFDPEALYALWSAQGALIAGNVSPKLSLPSGDSEHIEFTLSNPTADAPGHAAVAMLARLPDNSILLVGRDVQSRLESRRETLWAVVWTLILVAILGCAGALLGGRRVLREVEHIATTTRRIATGDLTRRVRLVGSGDEFDQLALAVNTMLDRIEELNAGMQTVIDSVAHDLRRPLTHARQTLELAREEADEQSGASLAQVDQALCHIQSTLDALLLIVQADAGVNSAQMEHCALDEMARNVIDLYEPLAESSGIRLALDAPTSIVITAHKQLLAQAVVNLIDNAIKFAPTSNVITVAIMVREDKIKISVSDQGQGIVPQDRDRVIGRFVRLVDDTAVPGSGLGLSLVASIARLHRGTFRLSDAQPGLCATLELPMT